VIRTDENGITARKTGGSAFSSTASVWIR